MGAALSPFSLPPEDAPDTESWRGECPPGGGGEVPLLGATEAHPLCPPRGKTGEGELVMESSPSVPRFGSRSPGRAAWRFWCRRRRSSRRRRQANSPANAHAGGGEGARPHPGGTVGPLAGSGAAGGDRRTAADRCLRRGALEQLRDLDGPAGGCPRRQRGPNRPPVLLAGGPKTGPLWRPAVCRGGGLLLGVRLARCPLGAGRRRLGRPAQGQAMTRPGGRRHVAAVAVGGEQGVGARAGGGALTGALGWREQPCRRAQAGWVVAGRFGPERAPCGLAQLVLHEWIRHDLPPHLSRGVRT